LTFANVPATAPPRTIRPGTGKPTTIITWPITHSRQSAKPRPRRRSSTCQIVIAERRRTMVEKSRRQQLDLFLGFELIMVEHECKPLFNEGQYFPNWTSRVQRRSGLAVRDEPSPEIRQSALPGGSPPTPRALS